MTSRLADAVATLRHHARRAEHHAAATDHADRAWWLGRASGLEFAADLLDVLLRRMRRERR